MSDVRLAAVLVAGLVFATVRRAEAQELEPRAYSNSPVGLNFFVAGYSYSSGGLSFDPSLMVEDAKLKIHSGLLGYARELDLWGRSGRVDVLLPYLELSGTATVAGLPATRQVSGLGDPRLRLSINLYGAPALSLDQFRGYKRDLVIGASTLLSAPLGQYDSSRAINLGTNRWSVRADVGVSKALGAFTLDVTAGAVLFTENDNFFGGKTLEQAPVYAAQANVSYDFGRNVWAAIGTTYYRGGRTTTDGVESHVQLGNARAGAILALPLSRYHSLKLSYSRGLYVRTGTDFSVFAVAWQLRWGAGY